MVSLSLSLSVKTEGILLILFLLYQPNYTKHPGKNHHKLTLSGSKPTREYWEVGNIYQQGGGRGRERQGIYTLFALPTPPLVAMATFNPLTYHFINATHTITPLVDYKHHTPWLSLILSLCPASCKFHCECNSQVYE